MWRCSLRGPCGSGCSGVGYGEIEMQFEESRSIYRNLKGVYCSGQILLFP